MNLTLKDCLLPFTLRLESCETNPVVRYQYYKMTGRENEYTRY